MNTDLNGSILVVDDTRENLHLLASMLNGQGYLVRPVSNGPRAISSAQFAPPDLILLDIMMPEMDGYAVCQALKADERTREIPIIFISALYETLDKVKAFELGGVDYITKPFQDAEVLARVKTHLELKRARESIQKQNQELIEAIHLREDVERITRHDLKTPLNSIINIPEFLMADDNLTETQVAYLKTIKKSGYRMLTMINRSLDLFRMERGIYQLMPVPVDLAHVMRHITTDMQHLLQSGSITLNVLSDGTRLNEDTMFFVMGEELLCYTMLANLIKNALEASPKGACVTLVLESQQNDEAMIHIHNSGTVPQQIHDRFFEKYVTSGKGQHGTGLGTYSARLFAEIQHGVIGMTSSEQDGTTITIRLPKAAGVQTKIIRQETGTSAPQNQPPIIPPRQEDLIALYEHARIGNILGIEECLKTLAEQDQRYSAFVAQMRHFRERFQILDMREFIKGFLQNDA